MFALASGYLRFRALPLGALTPALVFPFSALVDGAPNLMPSSGSQIPGMGATGALVGVGAVRGSSAGAGAL